MLVCVFHSEVRYKWDENLQSKVPNARTHLTLSLADDLDTGSMCQSGFEEDPEQVQHDAMLADN